MKAIFLSFLFCICVLNIQAQYALEYVVTHEETYPSVFGQYHPFIAVDGEDNVITAGTMGSGVRFSKGGTLSNTGAGRDIFIVKHNTEGEMVWGKTLRSSDDNSYLAGMQSDAEGNVYITGKVNGNLHMNPLGGATIFTPNNPKGFVAKYNSDGEYLWHREFGSNAWFTTGEDIAVDKDGNVYVTGDMGNVFRIGDIEFSDSAPSVFCLKLNGSGGVEWVRSYFSCANTFREKIVVAETSVFIISATTVDFESDENDLKFLRLNPANGDPENFGPLVYPGKQYVRDMKAYEDYFTLLVHDYSNDDKYLSSRVYTKIAFADDVIFSKKLNDSEGTIHGYHINEDDIFVTTQTHKHKLVRDPNSAITPLVFTGDGYSSIEKVNDGELFDEISIPTDGVVYITEFLENDNSVFISGLFFGRTSFALDSTNLDVNSGREMKAFVAKYSNCVSRSSISLNDCAPVEYEDVTFDSSGKYTLVNSLEDGCVDIKDIFVNAVEITASTKAYEDHIDGTFGNGDIFWYDNEDGTLVASGQQDLYAERGQYYVKYEYDGCEYISNPITIPTRRLALNDGKEVGLALYTSNQGRLFVEDSGDAEARLSPVEVDYPDIDIKNRVIKSGSTGKNIIEIENLTLIADPDENKVLVYDLNVSDAPLSTSIVSQDFSNITIDAFGHAMALYDRYLFIAAPHTDLAGNRNNGGLVQIYKYENNEFRFYDNVVSPFFDSDQYFGSSMHIADDHLYVYESGYSNEYGHGRWLQYNLDLQSDDLAVDFSVSLKSDENIYDYTGELAFLGGHVAMGCNQQLALSPTSNIQDVQETLFMENEQLSKLSGNGDYVIAALQQTDSSYMSVAAFSLRDGALTEEIRFFSNDDGDGYAANVAIADDNTVLVSAHKLIGQGANGLVYYYNLNDFLMSGIEELDAPVKLSIYPNPSSGKYTLSPSEGIDQVHLFDTNGVSMGRYFLSDGTISLEDIPNGVYILKVLNADGSFTTEKIVKMN